MIKRVDPRIRKVLKAKKEKSKKLDKLIKVLIQKGIISQGDLS